MGKTFFIFYYLLSRNTHSVSARSTMHNEFVTYNPVLFLTCMLFFSQQSCFRAYAVLTVCGTVEGEKLLGSPNPWGWRVWVRTKIENLYIFTTLLAGGSRTANAIIIVACECNRPDCLSSL